MTQETPKPEGPADRRAVLKDALRAIEELQSRLDSAERARREPIAIVGMACRFPGGVSDPESYWRLLRDGVDAIREVPPDRWDVDRYYDPDPAAPGKTSTRWGGFLDQVDRFDARFFGVAPREAVAMDPQHRLLLEVAWEALENGGQAPGRLTGSQTGVFVGITTTEYMQLHTRVLDLRDIDAYLAPGNTLNAAAGRVAYLLGLHGPAMAVDTACSSSLVAVHLACQSLREGESDMALAGGVNVILVPETFICFSKWGMMARDGRCKTFDAAADGFVRSEGSGVVVLKRLSDALAAGDRVLAVIRGSAVNQDGPSSGLTVPNGLAQEAVIRKALANSGVDPGQVGYVEAHGTGTSLGDPIEVEALGAVLGPGRSRRSPVLLGSVKTNLGHLESSSGIAALIKVVLSLQHREVPPHLHLKNPSPQIPWDRLPFVVPTARTPWPDNGRRIAGVSAFGFSGTNAHVVLEEAPAAGDEGPREADRTRHVLTLSARTEEALRDLAARFERRLGEEPSLSLADVAYTANAGRSHFASRLALVAESTAQAREAIEAFLGGRPSAASSSVFTGSRPRVTFLFTGQGAQYVRMGRGLFETQPTFRRALRACDELLRPHLERPLLSVLYPEGEQDSPLDDTAYAQPALFALEYALAELWRSWGVEPAAVMGHSVGEYVAACVAGVFDLESGLRLIAERGRLMQALPRNGAMAAVMADEARVSAAAAPHARELSIAAVNGPANVVVSGRVEAVGAVVAALAAQGVRAKRLTVSHAFHSPLVEPILPALEDAVSRVPLRTPRIPLVSNLTGRAAGEEVARPEYWRRHAREAVRFAASIQTLREKGHGLFLEVGPSPTLLGMAARCLPEGAGVFLPSLRRGLDDWQPLLESVAALHLHGVEVDWRGFDRDYRRRKIALPTYPFQRERYWVKPRAGSDGAPTEALHPLLGRRLRSPLLKEAVFETRVGASSMPFLVDHRVSGTVVFPATGYLEMAAAAAAQALGGAGHRLEDVAFQEPLVIGEGEVKTAQVVLIPGPDGASEFKVFGADRDGSEGWTLHASGRVRASTPGEHEPTDLAGAQHRCGERLEVESYYQGLRARGLDFGPRFQAIEALWRGAGESVGRIRLPDAFAPELDGYGMHPAVLDSCLQVFVAAWPPLEAGAPDVATYLPLGAEAYVLHGRPDRAVWSHARLRPGSGANRDTFVGDLAIFDQGGVLVGEVRGFLVKRADRDAVARASGERLDHWLYEVEWRPQGRIAAAPAAENALSPHRIAARLQDRYAALGAEHGVPDYERFLPELESLSGGYALRALFGLGWKPAPGRRISVEFVAAELGVVDRHRRLLGRILGMLAEDGLLKPAGDGWEVARVPEGPEVAARVSRLATAFPGCAAQLRLVERCGEQLGPVLRGRQDPLQLLFPGGSLAALEELYERSPFARLFNGLVSEALAGALAGRPPGQPLRVLEIGAGTGGTTSSVLPLLPRHGTEYVFTDVSPAFLTKARQKFREYPFVRYELLDVEIDPTRQGLTPGGFDVVLAANVLHATRDLRQTVEHVARLVAPEGLLVLLEGTGPQRWVDLTFGMTEGWWRFADPDLRPSYALLSRQGWLELLSAAGFSRGVTVPSGGGAENDLGQTVVLARGPRPAAAAAAASPAAGRWLILGDRGGVGRSLAGRLEERGESSVLVEPGGPHAVDPTRPEDFRRLVAEALGAGQAPCRGVVHLLALDAPLAEDAPGEEVRAAEAAVCGSLLHLVQALATAAGSDLPRLWVVTRGAQPVGPSASPLAVAQAAAWGLGRIVALEHPELRCVRVDLDPAPEADVAGSLLAELDSRSGEDQVGVRGDVRHVARLVRSARRPDRSLAGDSALRLEATTPGVLDGLSLRPAPRRPPGPGEVEIAVAAVGLNFRDVLSALGMYPGDAGPLGGECAGRVAAVGEGVEGLDVGDEVAAIAAGAFASHVTTRAELAVRKPPSIGFEEAATIPSAFMTAHHTLCGLARLAPGQRVLIHAASGGVGLAAVQLAQRVGAEVWATAGSPHKREFLAGLGVRRVMDSRSLSFADEVKAATGGEGVDVVLNSLTGESIPRSLSVLKPGGTFVEIGKRDIWDAARVAAARADVTYHAVDLAETARRDPAAIGSILREVMVAIDAGTLRPLARQVFPFAEAAAAFRLMAQAKHVGKIVVSVAPRAARFDPEGSYLITGGLAGLGLLAAGWMLDRGARHLVLMGRSTPSAEARETIAALEGRGARIQVVQGDASREQDVASVLDSILRSMPPLRGILHSAGVLADAALVQQDWERFAQVLAPKVEGGWHLHRLTRHLPLDSFILFSSASALIGSRGQGNHASANAFLDALAHHRRASGLPAVSIGWGAWSEVGAAAERGVGERIKALGIGTIGPEQGLRVLEEVLSRNIPQIGVVPIHWPTFARQFPVPLPFFSDLARESGPAAAAAPAAAPTPDLAERLSRSHPSQRREALVGFIREQAVRVLGLDPSRPVDPTQPLHELGLDSLMAVELRNRLGAGLGLKRPLSATLLFDYPTVGAVADHLAREVLGWEPPAAETGAVTTGGASAVDEVLGLSEEEAEAVLLQELSSLKKAKDLTA